MAFYDVKGNLLSENVPIKEYYQNEMDDTIAKIRELNDEPSIVFPLVTDIHRFSSSTTQTFENMINNITKFTQSVKCDFVINLGDTIDGNTTQAESLGFAYDCLEDFHSIGVPLLYAQGNHDNNPYTSSGTVGTNQFDISQVFKAFFSATKNVTYNFSENGTDYYFDMPIGVRVIVLNACNVNVSNQYGYGTTTNSWLSTALNTDQTVLLFEHLSSIASQVWNNCHGTNATNITNTLTSFVNNGGKLVQMSGHSHVDIAFLQPWLSVVQVCQKCVVANTTSSRYQVVTGYIDSIVAPNRTEGTYTEDAWSACVLKPNSGELDCVRFGGGVDRYFHYIPISPTTLTTRLSNVTWSSSDTNVATVSNGVVTGVASGTCGIIAKDTAGNYEAWTITVP